MEVLGLYCEKREFFGFVVVTRKMSDGSGKTSSSLVIAEKRTTSSHRPGGCVGIFFQLFDWNRRFAKKKLFSKKFLPPG